MPVIIYDSTMFNNLKQNTYLYIYIVWPNNTLEIFSVYLLA